VPEVTPHVEEADAGLGTTGGLVDNLDFGIDDLAELRGATLSGSECGCEFWATVEEVERRTLPSAVEGPAA
jgi:hypothetical protein